MQQTLKLLYIISCVHRLLLFNHSHLAVLSAVFIIVSMTFLFLVPTKPMSDRALHRDLATTRFEPTSIGVQLAFNPLFMHVSRGSSYLNFFRSWASFTCSSHGTVNSHIFIFFILFENINISGSNDVWAIWSGNSNLVSKTALNSQSVVCDGAFGVEFSFGLDFTHALTYLMKFFS